MVLIFILLLLLVLFIGFRFGGVRKMPEADRADGAKPRQRRRRDDSADTDIIPGSEPWRGSTARQDDGTPPVSGGGGRFGGGGASGSWGDQDSDGGSD